MPILQKNSNGITSEFTLPIGRSRIGRSVGGFLEVPSLLASKVHAVVECDEFGCSIMDNSKNGTVVNGKLLPTNQTRQLKNGDQVCIADTVFVYLDDTGSGARPTSVTMSSASTADDDSVRHSSITPEANDSPVSLVGCGDLHPEKIQARLALTDQSFASVSIRDSVKKLSHVLRLSECIRAFSEKRDRSILANAFCELFPQTDRLIVAVNVCPRFETYRPWFSHCTEGFSHVICDDVIKRAVVDRAALLVRDQWRAQQADEPILSQMRRVSLLCSPLLGSDSTILGVIQLISAAPGAEFELVDLERLAILAQVLTIVVPRSAIA